MASRVDTGSAQDIATVGATADATEFAVLAEGHRRELQVHCYRILGSFEDSEDLVQETFLRAWRKRETFEGRSTFRAWLYRIATNACLDFLHRNPRTPVPRSQPQGGADPAAPIHAPDEVPWLQPYPDRLMDASAPSDAEPDAVVISKETIELAFLVAIQHLPPKQRAVLVLRDVLGWSASETARAIETSVASVNSALQRARATVKQHLPASRSEWGAATDPSEAERTLLQRYMDALEQGSAGGFAALVREDVRLTMPPEAMSFVGKSTFLEGLAAQFDPESEAYFGRWRAIATRANRQPAVAAYIQQPGETAYRAQVLDVLWIEDGLIAEITSFPAELFPAFGLPQSL